MCGKKFYICRHCGNIIGMIKNSGVPVVCCGEKMQELVANSVDAAVEKHVPVATYKCNKVTVQIRSRAVRENVLKPETPLRWNSRL